MSHLDKMQSGMAKPQVAFHAFALSATKYENHLFCFFEGKDNAYYIPRIKQYTLRYHPINCQGKAAVLGVHGLIAGRPEYRSCAAAFFVDRDFDDPLPPMDPPIFETPCYAVENLYTSADTFREILINELHLSEVQHQETFDQCMQLFVSRQQEFHVAVTLFNAWYACLIEARNKTGIHTGVQLEDKLPKGWVEVALHAVSARYDLMAIEATFPQAPKVLPADLEAKQAAFRSCDCRRTFRGKYELHFLTQLLGLLIQDSQTSQTAIHDKLRFSFDAASMNIPQALNIFEAYAETPQTLHTYLRQVVPAPPAAT